MTATTAAPWRSALADNKDLALVGATIGILMILFAPIPTALLDLAIIMNFGFALSIMLLTFYVGKPVEFSTFPSLLLVATLYRLSLNVAATRLILTGGDAGDVIGSIGAFAVQGNFVVGLVVFAILVVVQYVVVTAGAQRVSEVAARFTLDSMPGQQMSIDADLNMGLIDQKEAIRRREGLEKEANFYGAMDGASKFVKGDAIAGIIILLINIVAGWIVGVTQMGLGWSEALHHFTLLTIGDGIATQLPALVISIATGIIVTRSAADKQLSLEIFRQLTSEPRIPLIVAAALLALLLMPGMPKWPILLIALGAAGAWWRVRQLRPAVDPADTARNEADSTARATGAMIDIAMGAALADHWRTEEAMILDRIASLRSAHEGEFGVAFPTVKLLPEKGLGTDDYAIRLLGARYGSATILPDHLLAIAAHGAKPAIDGVATTDPAFGLPAWWIKPDKAEAARTAGCSVIDPVTVLVTHLGEIVRGEIGTLMTRAATIELLDAVRARQPGLVEELIPNILAVPDVQRVLQNMLSEGVSVAQIDTILEHLTDLGRTQKDPAELTELVRQRMAHAICNQLRGRHPDLAVLSLDPRIENQITSGLSAQGGAAAMPVDPRLAEQIVRKLAPLADQMFQQGRSPVLLCAAETRRAFRTLTRRAVPRLAILSVQEIPMRITLKSFDVVRLEG
jgi:flagellar biosynthesis protein FlhA